MSEKQERRDHYSQIMWMAVVSFVGMYTFMYYMVDTFGSQRNRIGQVYVAGVMTMPMIIIEMILLGGMYRNKKIIAAIVLLSLLAFLTFYLLIPRQ